MTENRISPVHPDAHKTLGAAVDLCYRPAAFKAELERLKFLFDLYRNYTEPLIRAEAQSPRKKKKSMVPQKSQPHAL